VASSRVRQADVTKVAKQIRCNEVVEMGLEDAKRQVERSLVQDRKSLFGDLLVDQEDGRTSLLDNRSRFSGVRGDTQQFQVVTAVLVDWVEWQSVFVDHGAKFLGQVAETERNLNRIGDRVAEDEWFTKVDTKSGRVALGERHGNWKVLTSKTTEDDNEERTV
jgi:hypothetical protein